VRWDLGAPAESGRQSLVVAHRGKVCTLLIACDCATSGRARRRAAPRRDAKTAHALCYINRIITEVPGSNVGQLAETFSLCRGGTFKRTKGQRLAQRC
jgi:hypothetical protein